MSIRLSEKEVIIKEMAKKSNLTLREAKKAYFEEKRELRKVIQNVMETEDLAEGIELSMEMQVRSQQAAIYKEVIKLRKQEAKEDRIIKKEAKKVNKIIRKFIRSYEA